MQDSKLIYAASSARHVILLYQQQLPYQHEIDRSGLSTPTYYVLTLRQDGSICSLLEQSFLDRFKGQADLQFLKKVLKQDCRLWKSFADQVVEHETFVPCRLQDIHISDRDNNIDWQVKPGQQITYKDGSTRYISGIPEPYDEENVVKKSPVPPRRNVIFAAKSAKYTVIYLSEDTGPLMVTSHGIQPLKQPELYLYRNVVTSAGDSQVQTLMQWHWFETPWGGQIISIPIHVGEQGMTIGDYRLAFHSGPIAGNYVWFTSSQVEPMPRTIDEVKKSLRDSHQNLLGVSHWGG